MLLCSSVAKDTRHTEWPTINPTGGALDQIEQGVLAGPSVLSRDEWDRGEGRKRRGDL